MTGNRTVRGIEARPRSRVQLFADQEQLPTKLPPGLLEYWDFSWDIYYSNYRRVIRSCCSDSKTCNQALSSP
jgi:hypothetical protein